ncbi:MAG: hypothetical protein K2P65_08240 [Lachnospiraceae bacterium]|nr:hypothetical protein [Lachnospiraceae bacterium]
MRSISGMLSDELAGDAKRGVPIPTRRKANAKHFRNAFRMKIRKIAGECAYR